MFNITSLIFRSIKFLSYSEYHAFGSCLSQKKLLYKNNATAVLFTQTSNKKQNDQQYSHLKKETYVSPVLSFVCKTDPFLY